MSDDPTKTFLASAGKKFAGQDLHPLTKQREIVACEMGLKFGFVARYRPQYFLRDTIITLWLCSVDEKRVDQAEYEPEAAMKDAHKWAEKMGIGIDTPRFAEGYALFTAMMKEVQESRGEPVIPDAARLEEADESEL